MASGVSGRAVSRRKRADVDREFFIGLARAFAGALVFALPMLMTMEMWWLGFYMDPWRLVLLIVLTVPLLVGLSRFGGFKPTEPWIGDVVDAFVAFGTAMAMATVVLALFGVVGFGTSWDETIGKIVLQAVPGSIGAMLARSQFGAVGQGGDEDPKAPSSYGSELFVMVVGALFLSLNIAPTEEMVLIAHQMSPWQEIALVFLSLALMHAFVYSVEFSGRSTPPEETGILSVFLRFTMVGYALVLLVSLYMLWTFGRTDGAAVGEILSTAVVLGFPGAIGAAAARLVL
jgi:putative integral membrane protein (TIGR02587 family)